MLRMVEESSTRRTRLGIRTRIDRSISRRIGRERLDGQAWRREQHQERRLALRTRPRPLAWSPHWRWRRR
jgi:hypothetical protein